jgi:hypothetical protein
MSLSNTQNKSEVASVALPDSTIEASSISVVMACITSPGEKKSKKKKQEEKPKKKGKSLSLSIFNSSSNKSFQEENTQKSLTPTEKSIQEEKTPPTKPINVWKTLPTTPKKKGDGDDKCSDKEEKTALAKARAEALIAKHKAELKQKQKERDLDDDRIAQEKTDRTNATLEKMRQIISERKEKLFELIETYYAILVAKTDADDPICVEKMIEDHAGFNEIMNTRISLDKVTQNNILDTMDYDRMTKICKELKIDAPAWMRAMFKNGQHSTSSTPPPTKKAPSSSSSSSTPPPTKKAPSSSSSSSAPPPPQNVEFVKQTTKKQRKAGQETPSKCKMQKDVKFYRNEYNELYHISKRDKVTKQFHKCGSKGHGFCKDKNCTEVHICSYHPTECSCHGAKLCYHNRTKASGCRNDAKDCKFLHSSEWKDHPHQDQWPQ